MTRRPLTADHLRWTDDGLIPAIAQDASTGEVLMLAWMSRESLARTLDSQEAWFFSRSRRELWHKGATSGDRLRVRWLRADCDGDTLLLGVDPLGRGACHVEGERACFWNAIEGARFDDGGDFSILAELARVVSDRHERMPDGSYTTSLFRGGVDRAGKKVGEEAIEVVLAAKNSEAAGKEHGSGTELASETADLLYHLLVLAELVGLDANAVFRELARRRGRSSSRSGEVKGSGGS